MKSIEAINEEGGMNDYRIAAIRIAMDREVDFYILGGGLLQDTGCLSTS